MLGEEDTWTVKFAKPGPYVFGMWVISTSEENSNGLLPYVAVKPTQIIFSSFNQDVGVKTQSKSCKYCSHPSPQTLLGPQGRQHAEVII